MTEPTDRALTTLGRMIDDWPEAELASLLVALIHGNGGTIAEDDLRRQANAVRRKIVDARIILAMWALAQAGEVDLCVTAADELEIVRRATARETVEEMRAKLAGLRRDDGH
jgi:hypothetical protein